MSIEFIDSGPGETNARGRRTETRSNLLWIPAALALAAFAFVEATDEPEVERITEQVLPADCVEDLQIAAQVSDQIEQAESADGFVLAATPTDLAYLDERARKTCLRLSEGQQ